MQHCFQLLTDRSGRRDHGLFTVKGIQCGITISQTLAGRYSFLAGLGLGEISEVHRAFRCITRFHAPRAYSMCRTGGRWASTAEISAVCTVFSASIEFTSISASYSAFEQTTALFIGRLTYSHRRRIWSEFTSLTSHSGWLVCCVTNTTPWEWRCVRRYPVDGGTHSQWSHYMGRTPVDVGRLTSRGVPGRDSVEQRDR